VFLYLIAGKAMEEETRKWCRVSVRIESDALHPDAISVCLGMRPNFGGAIGDRLSPKNPKSAVRTCNIWGWNCPLPDETNPEDILEAALRWVESRRESWLKMLASSDAVAELFVGYSSTCGQGGFCLPPAMLQRMAELRLHLGLDLYPPELPEIPSTAKAPS
jgi:hypothetical protein